MAPIFARTTSAHIKTLGTKSKYFLFAACATAVWQKQKHYRASLADEQEGTADRINRTAYVTLPDGRLAQVYPVVHTNTTLCGMARALIDTFNPMP